MRQLLVCTLLVASACGGDASKATCGIRCTPAGECPADYACHLDGRCYLAGTPDDQTCLLDGGLGPNALPTIVSMSPQPNESNVLTGTTITVVFSEPVTGVSTLTFSITPPGTGTPVGADIFYDNDTHAATLQPWRLLRDATVYTVKVLGDIEDSDFNRLHAMSWEFTTVADQTPPSLAFALPADGALDVAIDDQIRVAFSEQVIGVTATSFYLEDATGTVVPSSIGYLDETAVSLTPKALLDPHATYTFHLTPAITDVVGHPLAGAPFSSSFRTGSDLIPPSIIAETPGPNDVDIPTSIAISVRFSEPMMGASTSTLLLEQAGTQVAGTVTYFPSTHVARLTPSAPLQPHTLYTVKITSGLTDITGNPVTSGIVSWSFTTGS